MYVSVIMPVYNEKIEYLDESINSVLSQTFKKFEYIIIDDNPSSLIIKRYLLNWSSEDKRIHILFNSHNIGAMRSANKAIRYSHYNLIIRMDADDKLCKNRIVSQILFMKNNNLDLVGSNFKPFDSKNEIYDSVYLKKSLCNQKKLRHLLKFMNIFMGPTLTFKRKVAKKLSGYRPILAEDYDFVVRAIANGFRVGYQGNSLVMKRLRNNDLSNANLLKLFIVIKSISKCLRLYNYKYILPVSFLYNKINYINASQYRRFRTFQINLNKWSKKKNIITLLNLLYSICNSKWSFCYVFWILIFVNHQDLLII